MSAEPRGDGPRRLRLLVLASTFPARFGDGTPSFVADLAAEQARTFETTVLAPAVPGAAACERLGELEVRRFRYFLRRWEDLADGAILENLRSRPSRWLAVAPLLVGEVLALRRAVRELRPDVLHVHWLVPQGVAALLGGRGVPWLVTSHGADVYALSGPVSEMLKRQVLRRAAAVTTVNADMRERLIALGAPPGRIEVVPMPPARLAAADARPTWAPIAGRVVFVGRLVEKKGVSVLLQALARLRHPWSCHVLGDGPLRGALEAQAADLGLTVTFLGQVGKARVGRALQEASVVALPSVPAASGDQDGLPVTLVEAMAAGRATVVSRLPGLVDAVVHEETGLLVPPGDDEALALALDRVLGDAELAARLGQAAHRRAELFSAERIGARYVGLLTEVLRRPR